MCLDDIELSGIEEHLRTRYNSVHPVEKLRSKQNVAVGGIIALRRGLYHNCCGPVRSGLTIMISAWISSIANTGLNLVSIAQMSLNVY